MTNYEKFIHNNSWIYKDDILLKEAYDRYWKSKHDILLCIDEFIAEVGERYDETAVTAAYERLVELSIRDQLTARKVYLYAHNCWCIQDAQSIVAYPVRRYKRKVKVRRLKWKVNNCDTAIDHVLAINKINQEWGFERNRITIIGVPYYSTIDYQFIRFDCTGIRWLWKNGSIYEIYPGFPRGNEMNMSRKSLFQITERDEEFIKNNYQVPD